MTTVGIMAVVITLIIVGLSMRRHDSTLQGQVETTDYRVASKVPSRVVKLLVKEGQRVHAGDTLVILSAPEVNAMEQGAVASRDVSQAVEQQTDNGTRQETVNSTYEIWQQAIAQQEIAHKTYQRLQALFSQGVVAAQRRDEALAAYRAASAAVRAAYSQYQLMQNGSRTEEKEAAAAVVRNAVAKIAEVKAFLRETVLTASADGYVSEVFVEPGEMVGTGAPILNVDTDEAWFTFNITEDKLPGIEYGTKVKVYLPASDETVLARVTRINNVGNFAAWKATRALDDVDLKVFEVQARPIVKMKKPHEGESAILRKN
jgi:HlyD family secretion protein